MSSYVDLPVRTGVRTIEIPIGYASATYDSATALTTAMRVLRTHVRVDTAFTAGATISVGQVGHASDFVAIDEVDLTIAKTSVAIQSVHDVVPAAIAGVVRVTIGGAPVAGAGVVVVEYVTPEA